LGILEILGAILESFQQGNLDIMQVELASVAGSQRPTKQVKEEERDTMIVVGQARHKRKRTKAQQQNGAGKSNEPAADEVPSSSTLPEKEAEESNMLKPESFDFSAVHNILEDNPDLDDGDRKKRQKKQNKGQPLPFSLFPFFISSVGFIVLFCSRWSIRWGLPCASQGTQ
jgi:exosome complex exonuclease RRP6